MLQTYMSAETEETETVSSYDLIFRRLKDQYQQTALGGIKESSKMQLYSKLKTEHCTESYLSDLANVRHRVAMTRLRLSSHSLNIEKGRHTDVDREERICTLCGRNDIEDETHMLIRCPMYKNIRPPNFTSQNTLIHDQEKAIQILKNDDLKPAAKFIYEAFETRNIMLDTQTLLKDMVEKVVSHETFLAKLNVDVQNTIEKMVKKIERNEKLTQKSRGTYSIKSVSNNGLKIVLSKTTRDEGF